MGIATYDLDRKVFSKLKQGQAGLENWQGEASTIADYVSSWGLERFWATSRSPRLLGGGLPTTQNVPPEEQRYFAWGVARVVLCEIVGADLGIQANMNTENFQQRLQNLNFRQQTLLSDLLFEIAETVQFWTMRLKDSKDSQNAEV
jgi:hypothetical protein